jgi:hypothetical protein
MLSSIRWRLVHSIFSTRSRTMSSAEAFVSLEWPRSATNTRPGSLIQLRRSGRLEVSEVN